MKQVNITINGVPLTVPEGTTILEAARMLNINIPTLCYYEKLGCGVGNKPASCRVCVVEVERRRNLAPACATPITAFDEGMVIHTNTQRALKARRTVLELIMSDHPQTCLTCAKNQDCELQTLAAEFGISEIEYQGATNRIPKDASSNAIMRDLSKCIMCRRCETVCSKVQTVGALTGYGRGFSAKVATAGMMPLADTSCTFCGQCVNVCPTGAITGISYVKQVWAALNDPSKTVIVQTAPAVRVAVGQEFGFEPGVPVTKRLVGGLRALGFDKVFDTNFAADLTIMEEANEIVQRLKSGQNLPILTSCCPGWINFLEYQFPDLLNIPSSCKSPQQMFGAIAKSYYAAKLGIDPKDLVVVSVMPCQAKKYEASRPEFANDEVRDVDYVVTTRELCRMFKEAGVNLQGIAESEYDSPLGESSGAADIFGVTGGVLEAALRTVYYLVNGKNLEGDAVNFRDVRGLEGVKEASVTVAPGLTVNVAVASGLGNARKVLEIVRKEPGRFQAIEIMACPGGCINGGGQPYLHGNADLLESRMKGLYAEDEAKTLRLSHENADIKQLYAEFLGEPGSEKAHHLLHTCYHCRKK